MARNIKLSRIESASGAEFGLRGRAGVKPPPRVFSGSTSQSLFRNTSVTSLHTLSNQNLPTVDVITSRAEAHRTSSLLDPTAPASPEEILENAPMLIRHAAGIIRGVENSFEAVSGAGFGFIPSF
jgi:hypothetical protein